MRPNRRALATTTATVVLLLTAACGGGNPEPAPLPKASTSSASPTASAGPSAPVLPAAARAKTKAGAIAFAKHYVQLINHAQSTGDTAPLRAVEAATCPSCKQLRSTIEALYATGAKVAGGEWVIRGLTPIRNPASGGWFIGLSIAFGPQTVERPGTGKDQKLAGGKLPINMQLVWATESWKVEECTRGA